tara:strand:+ start:264 stop:491 length:228 start_codon:yes stop_codon:yes gene_type:complete
MKVELFISIITEERNLLSLEFLDLQTSQSQAITGTPCDVPVPSKVIFILLSYIGGKIIDNSSFFRKYLHKFASNI